MTLPVTDRTQPAAALPVRALRFGFGILALVALVWIPIRNSGNDGFSVVNYFSYFTVLSNVLSVVVLLVGGALDPRSTRWQLFRGAVTLYMVITCVVYAVLLAKVDVMLTDRWINDVMHRFIPLILLLDWLLFPPRTRIEESRTLSWLAFPAVYGVYSLIRGPIVDWYPYPFLDHTAAKGTTSFVVGLVVLAVVMALLALAMSSLGNLAARWRYRGDAGLPLKA